MTKFNKTLIAAALALSASSVYATPSFLAGTNSINFNSVENQYRSDAACSAGGCLAFDIAQDPAGWNRVDPSIPGNIFQGDVFSGILYIYKTLPSGWQPSATDEFTGYFAQEVSSIDLTGGVTNVLVNFTNPSVDPFGKLSAGEMFRLYTDTTPNYSIFGNTFDAITNATNDAGATFWGSLGVTDGYAYTRDDFTLSGADSFVSKFYVAVDVINKGPSYNAGVLNGVNDTSESQEGGTTVGNKLLCSAADLANSAVLCSDMVGNADIKNNDFYNDGSANPSNFAYEVNDPIRFNRVPEPATLALMGLGLIGLASLRRRAA